jgi:hypothetical protein
MPKDATMDRRLLPPNRADEITDWRIRRVDEGDKRGALLGWTDDDGLEATEWPVGELTVATIRSRWGNGRYEIEYYGTNEQGTRVGLGKSVRGIAEPGGAATARVRTQPADDASAPPVAPTASANSALKEAMGLFAFFQEQSERARAAMVAQAEVQAARYKVDVEAALERERIASQERLAQMAALAKQKTAAVPNDEIAMLRASIEGLRMTVAAMQQSADDDEDDEDEAPKTSGPSNVTDAIAAKAAEENALLALAIKELGPQLVPQLVSMFPQVGEWIVSVMKPKYPPPPEAPERHPLEPVERKSVREESATNAPGARPTKANGAAHANGAAKNEAAA